MKKKKIKVKLENSVQDIIKMKATIKFSKANLTNIKGFVNEKTYKRINLLFSTFIALLILLFFVNIIKKDFTYGHFLHSTYKPPYNWFYHFTVIPFNKFYIKLKMTKKNIYLRYDYI